jgi:hypothetical protein
MVKKVLTFISSLHKFLQKVTNQEFLNDEKSEIHFFLYIKYRKSSTLDFRNVFK